jgi:hypothetical protein
MQRGSEPARRARPLAKRLAAVAVAACGIALTGCIQYGGYNPSYTRGWDSAMAGYAAAGGAESDRIAINQCGVDGTWATWSGASYASELRALNDNGQAALIRLDSCHGPKAQGFNSFAADVVQRAAAIVPIRAVQVWSEPNFAVNWGGTINAGGYAKMFKAAYSAVKAVRDVPVISAGLAPVHKHQISCQFNDSLWMCPHNYLNQLLSKLRSMHAQVDGVGANFFPRIEDSTITADSALANIQSEYNSVDSVDQKFGPWPIWVTETGVRTDAISGEQQGAIMKTYGDWLVSQSDVVALYVWMLSDDNSGNPNYGVLATDGSPKGGSAGAYCQAAAERGLTPSGC